MNVLLIHQAFASPRDPGGTRHFELGRHLVQRGHGFTIVASDVSYLTGEQTGSAARRGLFSEENFDGVRVLRTYIFRSLHKSFFWRIVSFLSFMLTSIWTAMRAGKIDVVMGTTPPIFQAVSAWLVAALRRKPFLLEVRDLWPEFAIDMGILKNPALTWLSRKLENFLYSRATHLLVNSPAYRDYLLKKGIPAERISFISNGVDPDMFDPSATGKNIRDEWKLDGQFVVTYAGALGIANDIPTVLRAAERLRDEPRIRFLLVGDGKERKNLEEQTRKMSLPNVTFAGSRPKNEMNDILAASDACLAILQNIPMFRTTYPNKVFDYMAAARPTVLAIDGVIRDVVERANGGIFVQPGDDAALAAAVKTLSNDRSRAREMGAAARDFVTKNFNRHDQAAQFVALAEKLGQINYEGHEAHQVGTKNFF